MIDPREAPEGATHYDKLTGYWIKDVVANGDVYSYTKLEGAEGHE